MARLKQPYLPIHWDAIEECPDLQRVEMVLKNLPDALKSRRPPRHRPNSPHGPACIPPAATRDSSNTPLARQAWTTGEHTLDTRCKSIHTIYCGRNFQEGEGP